MKASNANLLKTIWALAGTSGRAQMPLLMLIISGAARGIVDFSGFNRDMLNYWASSCGAHWQCEVLPGVSMHESES